MEILDSSFLQFIQSQPYDFFKAFAVGVVTGCATGLSTHMILTLVQIENVSIKSATIFMGCFGGIAGVLYSQTVIF